MYTLITKIAYSQGLKDLLKVSIGISKVLISKKPQPQYILKDYESLPQESFINKDPIDHIKVNQVKQQQLNKPQPQYILKDNEILPQEPFINKDPIDHIKLNQLKQQQLNDHTILREKKPDMPQTIQNEPIDEGTKQSFSADLGTIKGQEASFNKLERQQSKVISSRLGRFIQYGKLGSQLLSTEAKAFITRKFGSGNVKQVYEEGAQRITQQLCRMRGAPLKIAQLLSIQEDALIPGPVRQAFEKAREHAHLMPSGEVKLVMKAELGQKWMDNFENFQMKPFAAASIGQVHSAVTKEGQELAVKIQYPGVERSIKSDISNLSTLLKLPGVLPKGIFIDKLLANTESELKNECNYQREAEMQQLYDRCLKQVMSKEEYRNFAVPKINKQLSSRHLLSSQMLKGIQVANLEKDDCPQSIRDEVGRLILKLTFSEIFEMGIMQSDPNPSNFTYDLNAKRMNLFDFGATHIYNEQFLRHYREIINASVRQDRERIIEESVLVGFLTREQNQVMLDQHYNSILVLGEPLRYRGLYDFGSQRITEKIYKTIPVMLKNRLKAPPQEAYSLHRKFSGAYLACIRMKSRVDCSRIYQELKQGNKVQSLNE